MRARPDGWLMPKVQPTTGQPEQGDPAVTWHKGRAYRHEGSQHDPDYGVKPADMEALRQRHVETMTERQLYADLNLRRALEAAPKLTRPE